MRVDCLLPHKNEDICPMPCYRSRSCSWVVSGRLELWEHIDPCIMEWAAAGALFRDSDEKACLKNSKKEHMDHCFLLRSQVG